MPVTRMWGCMHPFHLEKPRMGSDSQIHLGLFICTSLAVIAMGTWEWREHYPPQSLLPAPISPVQFILQAELRLVVSWALYGLLMCPETWLWTGMGWMFSAGGPGQTTERIPEPRDRSGSAPRTATRMALPAGWALPRGRRFAVILLSPDSTTSR